MRHVFIVNPAAGKKRGALELLPRIHAAFAGAEEGAYAIRVTRGAGDAHRHRPGGVRRGGAGALVRLRRRRHPDRNSHRCRRLPPRSNRGRSLRIRQRLCPVLRGTAAFLDIPAQVHGRAVPVDAVDCGDRVSMEQRVHGDGRRRGTEDGAV